ncbi:hypothetical protein [Gemmatimonas sp.]|jgi:hypothetical protein|uniref:hypothetical protein n=1 Tax=Gemmatimonas sp. TaxID=1962908 RepID=UPI0022CCA5F2|nr:hypothetical protein [Gemmatimonas sp.]MCZ8203274.1 hypothetical protein [Gemmatimonas sp.]
MIDRHLRPDEIELLLDGEEGFGVAQLRAHAASCSVCQAEMASAQEIMLALDALPDFAPSPAFADRVMSQVQVFEPWHAAATRTVEQFIPASRPARLAAGLAAAVGAGLATAGATWAVARADMGLLLAQLGLERFREQVVAAGSDLASTILGQPGLDALRGSSPEVMAVALGGFVAAAGMGVVGIRALASSSRTR